jgi:hypothetical protein
MIFLCGSLSTITKLLKICTSMLPSPPFTLPMNPSSLLVVDKIDNGVNQILGALDDGLFHA